MEGKLTEDLIIQIIQNLEKSQKKIISIDIPIDENGNGNFTFPADGYLDTVILPEVLISFPTIKIYPKEASKLLAFHLKDQIEKRVFHPRVQLNDIEGKLIDQFDRAYLSGDNIIDVSGAVPSSNLNIILVV